MGGALRWKMLSQKKIEKNIHPNNCLSGTHPFLVPKTILLALVAADT
jgi:hypothetical protein